MRFSDVVGQEQIKEQLQGAIKANKVSHAYVIHGERNSGKEFIAKIFAMALECEDIQETEPCNECHSCKQAKSKNHPDIIFVSHEKPNVIGVNDIRTQIKNDVDVMPYQGPKKIYIINDCEKMTPEAQNALLKTLEEPPEYAVILLLTSNLEALLPTIQSRCVILNMKPVSDEELKKFLMKEMAIPSYKAEICVAFARGNVGKARILANSEEFDKVKDEALSLARNIHDMEMSEIIASIKRITEYKFDVNDYLDILSIWYRDMLLYKATRDMNGLIFREEIQYIKKVADRSTYEGIGIIIDALEKCKARLKASVNFDLAMELLLLTVKEN